MRGIGDRIFRRGSTTFYNSSRFFPAETRDDVTTLYAFVRLADDFVDRTPQDAAGFTAFRKQYERTLAGAAAEDIVIGSFAELAMRKSFDPSWIACFLDTMEQDLWKRRYETIEETLEYVHGSAEVVGLMMARVMNLAPEADACAARLGRAFQYINFVRDLAEDLELGRTYLPVCEAKAAGLPGLDLQSAKEHPAAFNDFVRRQIARYRDWRREAASGFQYLPGPCLTPILTASAAFDHTANVIERDPFVVFRRKVRPSRSRIVLTAIRLKLAGQP